MSQAIISILTNVKDIFTGAFRMMDNDHAYIHQGKRFSAFHKATITTGATLQFSLVTPANKVIHWRPTKIKPSADKVDIQVFEGATVNVAGTQINYFNRNRRNTNTTGAVLRHGTTFTANGTELVGMADWLPGSAGTGTIREGESTNGAADEIILKPSTTYRFVVTNGSSASNVIGFIFNHYDEDI
jgi:hypothetical protein